MLKLPVSNSQTSEKITVDSIPPVLKKPQSSGFAGFTATSPSRPPIASQLSSGNTTASPQRDSLAGPVRRSKSPVGKHQAFGQYSTGLSRFAAASSRKVSQDELSAQQPSADFQPSSNNQPEFEDILKSKGEELANDRSDKPSIQAIERKWVSDCSVGLFS